MSLLVSHTRKKKKKGASFRLRKKKENEKGCAPKPFHHILQQSASPGAGVMAGTDAPQSLWASDIHPFTFHEGDHVLPAEGSQLFQES